LLTATITGAIISSMVLKQEVLVTEPSGMDEAELGVCGAADCPWYNMTAVAQRPSDNIVMCICCLLFGIKHSVIHQF